MLAGTLRRGVAKRLFTPAGQRMQQQRRAIGSAAAGGGVSYAMIGGVGLVGAGGLMYAARLRKNKSLKSEDVNEVEAVEAVTPEELKQYGVTLYRYLTCPFCGKVKAFLDTYGIPYKCVEVDPLMKSQMKGLGYAKVPFLKVHTADGRELSLADSYDIVTLLGKKVGASKDTEDVTKWRQWGADLFIRYLTLNLNRTLSEAWASAAYIDTAAEIPAMNKFASKLFGAPAMYLIVQHMVTRPKLLKAGYDGGDERVALYTQMNHWIEEGVQGKKFHGGDKPDAADTDVYGILNAIRGYPLYVEVLQNTKAKEWVGRMDEVCGRKPFEL